MKNNKWMGPYALFNYVNFKCLNLAERIRKGSSVVGEKIEGKGGGTQILKQHYQQSTYIVTVDFVVT